MTQPEAFKGDYVDLKFIKTRKVAQVHIEIPIEEASQFVAAFGAPNPASGVPLAMARIDLDAKPQRKGGKLTQRAGILCNEPSFWEFIHDQHGVLLPRDAEDAAVFVRWKCGVKSRAELDHNDIAAHKFHDLELSYNAWKIAA